MRLVCPNCAARYEVADDAIPPKGRDVQCANCGKTWFQDRATLQDSAAVTPRQAPKADKSVLDILRSEAERETAARQAENSAQSGAQADAQSGTTAPPNDAAQVSANPDPSDAAASTDSDRTRGARESLTASRTPERHPLAAKDGKDAKSHTTATETRNDGANTDANDTARPSAVAATSGGHPGHRGGLADLPDIDELNTSLRAGHDENGGVDVTNDAPQARSRTSPDRLGYFLAILIMLVLVALYVIAPVIVKAWPASGALLAGYTGAIDTLRRGLADTLASVVAVIQGLIG